MRRRRQRAMLGPMLQRMLARSPGIEPRSQHLSYWSIVAGLVRMLLCGAADVVIIVAQCISMYLVAVNQQIEIMTKGGRAWSLPSPGVRH